MIDNTTHGLKMAGRVRRSVGSIEVEVEVAGSDCSGTSGWVCG